MKKIMKSINLALIIALILTVFADTSALAGKNIADSEFKEAKRVMAEQGTDLHLIKDNNDERIVEATENGVTTKATFDKRNNTITLKVDDQDSIVINLNETATSNLDVGIMNTITENTWSNYEYDIDMSSNPIKWRLRRPNPDSPILRTLHKDVTETSINRSDLESFRSAVNSITL